MKTSFRPEKSDKEYPNNIFEDISLSSSSYTNTKRYDQLVEHMTADQKKGLEHALKTLRENEQVAIRERYKNKKTYKEVGEVLNVCASRASQVVAQGRRKLRHPSRFRFIEQGYDVVMKEIEKNEQAAKSKLPTIHDSIDELELSVRAWSGLHRKNIRTIGELKKIIDSGQLSKVRGIGDRSATEIQEKYDEYYERMVELNKEEKVYDGKIYELELPSRIYCSLARRGIESVRELKIYLKDIKKLRNIRGMGICSIAILYDKYNAYAEKFGDEHIEIPKQI